jgi:hypothetical protein
MELDDARSNRACPSTRSLAADLDRLSALPDCLIHTIMSFMKARQVVQTCVLSTRWRHLWRSVPCLNIDFDEFGVSQRFVAQVPDPDDPDDDDYNCVDKKCEDFLDFADILMLRRSISVLDSFRLRAPCFADTEAGRWIRRAMKYCTQDPVIQREGLSSSSWRLKRLHLCNVFLDDLFAKHVSSVCHSLEDLELHSCSCRNIHSITSHSLKNLVLKNCGFRKLSEITSPSLKTLIIDGCCIQITGPLVILAPSVSYLHLVVNFVYPCCGISINEMPCLAKAFIHPRGCMSESKLSGNILKLVSGVSNVKTLELKGFETMVCLLCLCQCSISVVIPLVFWLHLMYYRCSVRTPLNSRNSRT